MFAVRGVMEVEVEGVLCRASWYRDHGFARDHSGRNAHYGPFDWHA